MIWEKLVLPEWFIRGLVSVNCFLLLVWVWVFFFSFLNFYSLTVLFGFQERGVFFVYLIL